MFQESYGGEWRIDKEESSFWIGGEVTGASWVLELAKVTTVTFKNVLVFTRIDI